jgi:hypothetical protein
MDLQNKIQQLHNSFMDIRADDHDRKVENVKSRIWLMKKLIGDDPDDKGNAPTFAHKIKQKLESI